MLRKTICPVATPLATMSEHSFHGCPECSYDATYGKSPRLTYVYNRLVGLKSDIVCLHETRTCGPAVRMLDDFIVVASGAAQGGQLGCECWVRKCISSDDSPSGPTKIHVKPEHVCIRAHSPRLLVVALRAPGFCINILTLHAPTTSCTRRALHEFWFEVSKICRQHVDTTPWIVGVDANGRLGTPSQFVGSVGADVPDTNGTRLAQLLHLLGCFAANTFEFQDVYSVCSMNPADSIGVVCAQSQCHHTFCSNDGSYHRIDYVGLPIHWFGGVRQVRVAREADFGDGYDDHYAVICRCEVSDKPKSQGQRAPVSRRNAICDRAALADPVKLHAFVESVRSVPQDCMACVGS